MFRVTIQEAGMKLAVFLKERFGSRYSSRKIKKAIESNLCRVNGMVERFHSYLLKKGDQVIFEEGELQKLEPIPIGVEKQRILYEDESLLIYDKPSGLTSDTEGVGALFPGTFLVHRLDRETTGALILAKDNGIKEALIVQFREQKIKKSYLALVDGIPHKESGQIESRLAKLSSQAGNVRWGSVHSRRGLLSKTTWKLEKKGKQAALLRCTPHTGRTHQIRVHLKEMGHPILGDTRYAKKFSCPYPAKRCLLHAYEIGFSHPKSGADVYVRSPIPADFKEALSMLV